jgi:hypothetical protein
MSVTWSGRLLARPEAAAVAVVQEPIDGDLAARVFGLLQVVDTGAHAARVGEHSRQRLDIALLGFFQNFRKVYIGEQVMHCSKVRLGGTRKWGVTCFIDIRLALGLLGISFDQTWCARSFGKPHCTAACSAVGHLAA